MTAITRLYDHYADAANAVQELAAAGVARDDISIVAPGSHLEARDETETDPDATPENSGAGAGEAVGAIGGGLVGLLAGLGLLTIPGIGVVIAAGWLVAAVTGAGAGALVGSLTGALIGAAGIGKDHAHLYAEAVRRGETLVSVRVDAVDEGVIEKILARHSPVDLGARAHEYRAQGWTDLEK